MSLLNINFISKDRQELKILILKALPKLFERKRDVFLHFLPIGVNLCVVKKNCFHDGPMSNVTT